MPSDGVEDAGASAILLLARTFRQMRILSKKT